MPHGLCGWKHGGENSPVLSWRGCIGEIGYMDIMFQPGPSYIEQCIMGDGGKHCVGSGIVGM